MARPIEWTDQLIELEADYLVEWARKSESLVMGTCYGSRGYSYHDAKEWSIKNIKFRQAKIQATTLVGARRELGGLINKLNSNIVARTMPLYDPDYNEHLKEQRKAESENDLKDNLEFCQAINNLIKDQSIVIDNVDKAS